jgi:UDP-N-acetylglucosamine 2-epimerase (non-hydrolysing)
MCVVGARPNFMKVAPVMEALASPPDAVEAMLVHTGQHYDAAMKDAFFRQLGMPEPDVDLEVGSGTHAQQTGEVMLRLEPILDRESPDAVLVVGDVNSTLAAALVASKKSVPVIHVEAGLRSYDRTMPEEINRVLTDQVAELLFTTERSARDNLVREGIDSGRVHFVGNVMIDSLRRHLEAAVPPQETLARHGWRLASSSENGEPGFAVVTLHRPSNVDDPTTLRRLWDVLHQVGERLPMVFPLHPRTEARLRDSGLRLDDRRAVMTMPPVGYLEMLGLLSRARVVLTDSGGVQEETTALGVPCLTLRENTERPVTVEEGTNTVVGSDAGRILSAVEDVLARGGKAGRVPELWDGSASFRIKDVLVDWLAKRRPEWVAV